jgi:hypothetical protein
VTAPRSQCETTVDVLDTAIVSPIEYAAGGLEMHGGGASYGKSIDEGISYVRPCEASGSQSFTVKSTGADQRRVRAIFLVADASSPSNCCGFKYRQGVGSRRQRPA